MTSEQSEREPFVRPDVGEDVWYQTDGRNYDYYLPAKVIITEDNLVKEAVIAGVIANITGPTRVHLFVYGGASPYYEYDVPWSPEGNRRSWRFPHQAVGIE